MFKRILIANRGLIQANCVRAVKELGAKAIAVYEDDDKESAGVRNADEAYELIVRDPRIRPYLDVEQIVALAKELNVDAVHPGYGFLAQSKEFAKALDDAGIAFIAPQTEGVFDLSNKHVVKGYVAKAGLPILPGSECFTEEEWCKTFAEAIGYPLMIKSAYGYGGLGMRVIWNEEELLEAFEEQEHISERYLFDKRDVYLEKYLEGVKHVEFPVLRDSEGHVVVLPELECSVQRRFQKLVVETPSPSISQPLRQRLDSEIRVLVDRLGVNGFASVEFLIKDGKPYFLEINGYIQPSHTASSVLTGVDLLKEQIRLISGESLSVRQDNVNTVGHVINAYVFAEDPEHDFRPSPGIVERLYLPFGQGVLVQTSIFSGAKVSPFYDPMIAKVMIQGRNREEALNKMCIALQEFFVEGVRTNISFLRAIISSDLFIQGEFNLTMITDHNFRKEMIDSIKTEDEQAIAALVAALSLHRDANRQPILEQALRDESDDLGAAERWVKK